MSDKKSRSMPMEFENNQPTESELEAQLKTLSLAIEPEEEFIMALEEQLLASHIGSGKEQNGSALRLFQFPLNRARPTRWAAVAGILLAALVLLAASPATRASILGLFNGLSLVEEQALPTDEVEIVEPIVPDESYSATRIDDLIESASRPVPIPVLLPTDLTFTGGWISEDSTANHIEVIQIYHPVGQTITPETPYLLISLSTDTDIVPMLPRAHADWVQVNGQEALFIKGRWQGEIASQNEGSLENIRWDAAADAGWLSWTVEELNMLIVADGLALEQDALIQMAETLSWQ